MAQGEYHNNSNLILSKTKFTAEEALRILLESDNEGSFESEEEFSSSS
jgi:hypothetical protein